MAIHQAKYILTHYIAAKSQKKTAGFTLPELLVGMTVAGIALYAVLSLVVSLLGTEQRETAKSQTQQEMAQALDYIAAEIREAVHIYPGYCLQRTNNPPADCPTGGFNFMPNNQDVQPVLAFWKLERVSVEDALTISDDRTIQNNLAFYTLVIYSVRKDNPTGIWQGPARITRFTLPKYRDLKNPVETPGYNNFSGNFLSWDSNGTQFTKDVALVDGVDLGLAPGRVDCPDNYEASPPEEGTTIPNLSSFYACVSKPENRQVQEAMVFLRGDASARAGAPGSRNATFLPTVQTRVLARTRLDSR